LHRSLVPSKKRRHYIYNILILERRGRMPDMHVEVLLDCYKYVLQNRMLSSGRLGKGSFQEVADEMNKRCKMTEENSYEREQLAAKLQNLKTQFRNRKIAVDEGKGEKYIKLKQKAYEDNFLIDGPHCISGVFFTYIFFYTKMF